MAIISWASKRYKARSSAHTLAFWLAFIEKDMYEQNIGDEALRNEISSLREEACEMYVKVGHAFCKLREVEKGL